MMSEPLLVDRMDPKRKREEERYSVDDRPPRGANNNNRESSSDCYEESLAAGQADNTVVRSSWLLENHSWTHESVLRVSKKHYGVVSLKEQIRAIQQQLLLLKRRFGPSAEQCAVTYNTTSSREFQEARSMCNPFEELGLHSLFLNRAGSKLANLDALLDFTLTNYCGGDSFTFVDLCGAPGGFSEYLMKRCHSQQCRGYGMSLRGTNEHGHGVSWKLHNDNAFKVCHGIDGTGDVYKWENIEALQQEIASDGASCDEPPGKGVHLVVADGGCDAQRNAECQEELAQKLVVCQASAALVLLRKGGTLVMKMFGFQTNTTRTLVKALFEKFDKMTVLKPISSRPASAERYVVFGGYKGAPCHFDGQKWQHDVFLDNTGVVDHDKNGNLLYCLDECDRDILQLNQKACFEILSYMERKTQAHSQQHWSAHKPHVNMDAYKREWRLE